MKNYIRALLAPLVCAALLLPAFVSATTLSHPAATITATCVNNAPQVTLKWGAQSSATSYSVFRNKAATIWTNISSKQTGISLTDKNITSAVSYQYQVKAFFSTGVTYSNIVS